MSLPFLPFALPEIGDVQEGRDVLRDLLAVAERDPFRFPVEEDPQDVPLELGMHQLAAGGLSDSLDLGHDLRDAAGGGGHVLVLGLLACRVLAPANKKSRLYAHFLPTVAGQGKLAVPL